jgi:DUF4097 and DUF4098 domain-containing protein YvlB
MSWRLDSSDKLDFDDVREVRVRVVAGEVSVTGTSGTGAHLEVTDIRGDLDVEYADGVLTVTQSGLTWETLLDWRRTMRSHVTLALAVPAGCPTQVGGVTANVIVSALTGPTQVRSVSGRVTLDGLDGETTARTVSGDVEAVGLAGALHFETVAGELTVAGGGQCRAVTAKTLSGDIAVDLALASGGELALDAVSGDIVVRLPGDTGATVDATSVSGAVTGDFETLTRESSPGRRRLTGALGDGRGRVRAKSVSGDVTLVRSER